MNLGPFAPSRSRGRITSANPNPHIASIHTSYFRTVSPKSEQTTRVRNGDVDWHHEKYPAEHHEPVVQSHIARTNGKTLPHDDRYRRPPTGYHGPIRDQLQSGIRSPHQAVD